MTELEGRTSPGAGGPAWGGGHLALDAIVAYVDEELSPGAQRRALEHLSRCPECAVEVVAQTQARLALRASSAPCLPTALLHNLRDIPLQTELPEPPAGLSVGPGGQLFELQRPPRAGRRRPLDRRVRLGAGAVVSGLAIGALVVAGNAAAPSRGSAPVLPGAGPLPRASLIAPQAHFQGAMLDAPARSAPIPASAPARRSVTLKPALH
ncbi:MAG TPA: zf-HC2 domain-containing protein [Pseudonocardia sp.]|jgi:anti-sigma factor RsiW